MPLHLDRRLLVKAGVFGLGALVSLPGAAAILAARGFTHGVASGEPTTGSVLLWTRYVADGDVRLRCEVSEDAGFATIAGGGEVEARGEADHCAKLVVDGLKPGRWYYYRFIAPNGAVSSVGRTRTMPEGNIAQFNIALFSCSNMGFGWFNAYAHAARRTDIDLVVHVGDYLYEYERGKYPSVSQIVPGREVQPTHEMVTLADYRLRYASYRADFDLQRLHQLFPMIVQWDDHEFTNDAWENGAQNHQPETEGDWATRRAIAERVFNEWMPVSGKRYASYRIGTLATLFKPETRITGRNKQLELAEALQGNGDLQKALIDFRDGAWSDPARTLMGAEQEQWLYDGLARSASSGTRWQILAQQLVMGSVRLPMQAADWIPANAPDYQRKRTMAGVAASKAGLPFNLDAWDGYPAARSRLLNRVLETDSNLVVLSGDSHNAWGNNLAEGGRAAGVEFAGHSVASPGFEGYVPQIAPQEVAKALRETNPNLVFSDTSRRGYVSLQITPEAVTGEWHFLEDVRTRNLALSGTHRMQVRHGARVLA